MSYRKSIYSVTVLAIAASICSGRPAPLAQRSQVIPPKGAAPPALWAQMERGPHIGSMQDAVVGVERNRVAIARRTAPALDRGVEWNGVRARIAFV